MGDRSVKPTQTQMDGLSYGEIDVVLTKILGRTAVLALRKLTKQAFLIIRWPLSYKSDLHLFKVHIQLEEVIPVEMFNCQSIAYPPKILTVMVKI